MHAIVRGRFAPQHYAQGNLGRFIVTEAWVEEGDAVSDGVFVRAKTNGVQCIAAPCPTITEKALNTSRSANIAGVDWSLAEPDQDREIEELPGALSTRLGRDPRGRPLHVHENGRHAKGRTATAAYSRLVDAPTCFVGGCSDQVCSDQEGVITTCEWRPQYACYTTRPASVRRTAPAGGPRRRARRLPRRLRAGSIRPR